MPTKKPPAKKLPTAPRRSLAQLIRDNQELSRERDESLEREAATGDILRMIASAPADIQAVLDGIAERAARLCDAEDAAIFRVDGNLLRSAAHFGPVPMVIAVWARAWSSIVACLPVAPSSTARRFTSLTWLAAVKEFPGAKTLGIAMGVRTVLSAPLLRDGAAIGVIHIRRKKKRAFPPVQIKLLETFADQAVIAIENVRLFQELNEALEQQTATSEILGVIASSPTDIQPVLDAVAASAARVCSADDAIIRLIEGNLLAMRAHYGPFEPDVAARPIDRGSVVGRAVIDQQVVHIEDLMSLTATEFPQSQASTEQGGIRTVLAAPLQREGVPIGVILMRRTAVDPFTEKQIALLKTFADQAVIAIENVRLFKELGIVTANF